MKRANVEVMAVQRDDCPAANRMVPDFGSDGESRGMRVLVWRKTVNTVTGLEKTPHCRPTALNELKIRQGLSKSRGDRI
ncbi:MAG: hypothetical protein KDB23_20050, partial [Planctomycetales bacterium]|nr:hypothetical protein [Planctomycetales bacterium]